METFKFMKGDWVKEKVGNQLMQVDEYQIVETPVHHNGSAAHPGTRRVFSGKVWCTWVNQNKAVITQPFWEDDLEPAAHKQSEHHNFSALNHTH